MNIVTTGDRADMFMFWLVSDADAKKRKSRAAIPEIPQHMIDAVRETACTGQKGTQVRAGRSHSASTKSSVSKHPSTPRKQRVDEAIRNANCKHGLRVSASNVYHVDRLAQVRFS